VVDVGLGVCGREDLCEIGSCGFVCCGVVFGVGVEGDMKTTKIKEKVGRKNNKREKKGNNKKIQGDGKE